MDEKRKFSRVPFRIQTVITRNGESEYARFHGEVLDLSLNGMFVKTDSSALLGETLQCDIYLTGSSSDLSLNLAGKVVRIVEGGLALQFEAIDLDSFIHLKNIIAYNCENADDVLEEFTDFIKGNLGSRQGRS